MEWSPAEEVAEILSTHRTWFDFPICVTKLGLFRAFGYASSGCQHFSRPFWLHELLSRSPPGAEAYTANFILFRAEFKDEPIGDTVLRGFSRRTSLLEGFKGDTA